MDGATGLQANGNARQAELQEDATLKRPTLKRAILKLSTVKLHAARLVYVKTKQYESARSRLARNLVRIRGSVGLSQEQLADKAGFHRTYVGHLEQQKRNPSLENVEKLAQTLGVDVVDLLT